MARLIKTDNPIVPGTWFTWGDQHVAFRCAEISGDVITYKRDVGLVVETGEVVDASCAGITTSTVSTTRVGLTAVRMFSDEADVLYDVPSTNPKALIGDTKPSLMAVPMIAVYEMGKAMLDGVRKYGLFNWRKHEVRSDVYIDAAMRHINAWNDGEGVAADSGVHHLAHAMACMSIIIDAEYAGKLVDTRTEHGGFLGKYLAENTAKT